MWMDCGVRNTPQLEMGDRASLMTVCRVSVIYFVTLVFINVSSCVGIVGLPVVAKYTTLSEQWFTITPSSFVMTLLYWMDFYVKFCKGIRGPNQMYFIGLYQPVPLSTSMKLNLWMH